MSISFTCPHCGSHTEVGVRFAGQTGPCKHCGQTIAIPASSTPTSASGGAAMPAPKQSSSALPIILIVGAVVLCVVGVPVGLIGVSLGLPAVQSAREAARRTSCQNNLRQILLAMRQYEVDHGTLPPAYLAGDDGKPKHSWRVLLLPYLGHQDLYDQYDFEQPWDSPTNMQVARQMPDVYGCPSHDGAKLNNETSYFVVVGPKTAFTGGQGVPTSQITDPQADTILIVESHTQSVTWTEPVDLDFDSTDFNIDFGDLDSTHRDGINAGFADGHTGHLDSINGDETIRELLTRDGGEDAKAW